MFRKTAALLCAFMLAFSVNAHAMTFSTPKEAYYTDMSFSDAFNDVENADFLYRLITLGIIENVELNAEVTTENLTDVLKKAFKVKNISADGVTTNQQLVKLICDVMKLESAENSSRLNKYLDYGLIGKEYLPYYQTMMSKGYISTKTKFLRPNKPVTYLSLINILCGVENEIYARNSVKEINGKVEQIIFSNTTKTVKIATDEGTINVLIKKDRCTAYLKNGQISYDVNVSKNENLTILINSNNEVVLVESSNEKLDRIPNVNGIYKAKIYLYDYINGKIIFNDLQKYTGNKFVDVDGKYSEFNVSDTSLLYEFYRKTNGYNINRDFLDVNAYFIVDTNLNGENEIIYLNIVN